MPHVVLNGEVEIKDVFQHLQPLVLRNQQTLIRTGEKYLDSKETAILVESIAGTLNNLQQFLTLLNTRKDGLVIRIHPSSKIEKTPQVKQLLAEIAKQLLTTYPNLKVGKTNLNDFLAS